jgi:hypothetical protein
VGGGGSRMDNVKDNLLYKFAWEGKEGRHIGCVTAKDRRKSREDSAQA